MNASTTFNQITSLLSIIGQFLLLFNLPLILFSGQHTPWLAIAFMIFAPTLSMLLQLALSRTREFDADLGAAAITGDPEGLASALSKIERYQRWWTGGLGWPGRSGSVDAMMRTHPATRDRIERLRAVAGKTALRHRVVSRPNRNMGTGLRQWPGRAVHIVG